MMKNCLELVDALKGADIVSVFDQFSSSHIAEMKRLNHEMVASIGKKSTTATIS